jgi:4-hydroxy-tetrahydrodipicolinate synthase
MTTPSRLQGVFTPNIVPLDSQGEIHEAELRRYIDWLIAKGINGLYPNGSTGEFTRFTPAERRRIVEIVTDQAQGRVPVLAGAAEANVRETLAACDHYASLGVRAVAVVSPYYFKLDQDSIFAYYKDIGDHSPVDVVLYNIPMFANPIGVATVQRLAESCPRIVAIKDSSGDIAHMIRMIAAVRPSRPDFAFLTGWDAALMPMLLVGCDGAVMGSSGAVPDLTRRLFDLITSGQLNDARGLQSDLTSIFDALLAFAEVPEGFREAVKIRGFSVGDSRQPRHDANCESRDLRSRALRDLLMKQGQCN